MRTIRPRPNTQQMLPNCRGVDSGWCNRVVLLKGRVYDAWTARGGETISQYKARGRGPNDEEFIEHVRDRQSMYGLRGTYYPTSMFIMGFDQARAGGLLRGFHEWLAVRNGELSSQHWLGRVLAEALPDLSFRGFENLHLEPEQERQAVDRLFSLVLEFLAVRDDPRALASMYARYHSL